MLYTLVIDPDGAPLKVGSFALYFETEKRAEDFGKSLPDAGQSIVPMGTMDSVPGFLMKPSKNGWTRIPLFQPNL